MRYFFNLRAPHFRDGEGWRAQRLGLPEPPVAEELAVHLLREILHAHVGVSPFLLDDKLNDKLSEQARVDPLSHLCARRENVCG